MSRPCRKKVMRWPYAKRHTNLVTLYWSLTRMVTLDIAPRPLLYYPLP